MSRSLSWKQRERAERTRDEMKKKTNTDRKISWVDMTIWMRGVWARARANARATAERVENVKNWAREDEWVIDKRKCLSNKYVELLNSIVWWNSKHFVVLSTGITIGGVFVNEIAHFMCMIRWSRIRDALQEFRMISSAFYAWKWFKFAFYSSSRSSYGFFLV